MDHKSILFHSKLVRSASNDAGEDFWKTWTTDDLPRAASSKIMGALGVIEHYDDPKASPMYFKRDGTRDLQKEEICASSSGNDSSGKPRKILMFIMYEIHREIIKTALSLKGRRCLVYDGNMSTRIREQVVAQFEKDDDVKILLISNVGTTGLNLTMASVVIFVSGLWSGLETKQTIGRCWRQGQTRIVHVYHIIVPDTVDEMLCGYANGKLLMWGYFLRRNELIYKLFEPSDREPETQCDDVEDEAPLSLKTKSHAHGRALKVAEIPEDCSSGSTVRTGEKRKAETSSGQRKKARLLAQLDGAAGRGGAENTVSHADNIAISREPEALPISGSPQSSVSAPINDNQEVPDDPNTDIPSPSLNIPILGAPSDIDAQAMNTGSAQNGSEGSSRAIKQPLPLRDSASRRCPVGSMTATSSSYHRLNPPIASPATEAGRSTPLSNRLTGPDQCEDVFMRDLLSEMDQVGKVHPPLPDYTAKSTVVYSADVDLAFDDTESIVDKRDDLAENQMDVGQARGSNGKRIATSKPRQSAKHIVTQLQPSPLTKRPVVTKPPVSLKRPIVLLGRPTERRETSRYGVGRPAVSIAGSPQDESVSSVGPSSRPLGQFKKDIGQNNRATYGKGNAAATGAFGRPASGAPVCLRSPPRNAKPATGRTVDLDFSALPTRERQSRTKD
ncbi:hypothetical protein FRC06_001771 [Ceratobasidium sp. 370]|nr:hypothetical protein FRC06_001771 [Ceratobasidium sp. 370]